MSNAVRNFDILAINLGILHILIMQQDYFQICITNLIDTSAKIVLSVFIPLSQLSHLNILLLKISNCIRILQCWYDAICMLRDFAELETKASGTRETSALHCVSHPHANYPCTHDVTLSLSEWNYRYYRLRRKRETRAPYESTEGCALHIHGNCRGWVAKCVGRSL